MESDPIPGPDPLGVSRSLATSSTATAQLVSSALPGRSQSTNESETQVDTALKSSTSMAASPPVVCRGQKRARCSAPDELADNTTGALMCPLPPSCNEADGFSPVVRKSERKRLLKEELALEKLKNELAAGNKGVFKITLQKKPVHTGGTTESFPAGSLMNVFKELHRNFPTCSLGGGVGGIYLWAPTVEVAQKAMEISTVADIPVAALCSSFASFRARIDQVSMAFTVEEIVAELAPVGVISAQKIPYSGAEGRPAQVGKVRLVFNRPPPTSVFLGYRAHSVTMEAEKPLICFNCQRLGHHSSRCSLPRACKRCGGQGHLAASCANRPHCVNCRGSHASGSIECPRIAFAAEKNRILMEARVLQQVRISSPSAFIDSGGPDARPTGDAESISPNQPTGVQTYASVVRSITVAKDGESAAAVLLPKPRGIPKKKRRTACRVSAGQRKGISKKGRPRNTKKAPARANRKGRAGLSALAGLLRGFSPRLATALAALAEHLEPLLRLMHLLQGSRHCSTKTHNG